MSIKNNVVLSVGHIERHNEVVKHAKKNISEGNWGQIYSITARRFSNFPDRIRDVGVLFDLSIHDVDILSHLTGSSVKSVFTMGGKSMNKVHEDHIILSLEFDNGILGLCETNWLTPTKVRDLCITTDKFFINLDYIKQEIKTFKTSFENIDKSNLFRPNLNLTEDIINF